jgi:hypothetical protein
MTLVIQLTDQARTPRCAVCGAAVKAGDGPQLCEAESADAVCRACAKQHAPSLVALLDLARTAERVGHIGRHGVFPPLTALLDLASAAEKYLASAPRCYKQVG